jgi:hypothetical protein
MKIRPNRFGITWRILPGVLLHFWWGGWTFRRTR